MVLNKLIRLITCCNNNKNNRDGKTESKSIKIHEIAIYGDILRNIFSRLDGRTLAACTCVSTYWNSLITDSYFTKSISRRMIISYFHEIDVKAQSVVTHDLPFSFHRDKHGGVVVLGTFNGIVLLASLKYGEFMEFVLYNPFTRASKMIPHHPHFEPPSIVGFVSGDDLKIVIGHDERVGHSRFSLNFGVFSFKTGSWITTSKDGFDPLAFSTSASGLYLNGFLYWTCIRCFPWRIMALDVKEMVVSWMTIPFQNIHYSYEENHNCLRDRLGILHGRLCIVETTIYQQLNVWVIKEDGLWSKEYSLTLGIERDTRFDVYVLCILENAKFVLRREEHEIIFWDPSKDLFNVLRCDIDISRLCNGTEYVRSLVSPSYICKV